MSSVFEAGLPQEEQKRTLSANSIPQFEHLAMKISRSSLQQTADLGLRTSDFRPQTSDFRPQNLTGRCRGPRSDA
jgi:hypothetical protein